MIIIIIIDNEGKRNEANSAIGRGKRQNAQEGTERNAEWRRRRRQRGGDLIVGQPSGNVHDLKIGECVM